MIHTINGDITTVAKGYIVQQVNGMGVMGRGLAAQIQSKYPQVREDYLTFCKQAVINGEAPKDLLGVVQLVGITDTLIVANIFGQEHIRKHRWDKTVYTKKEALCKGLKTLRTEAERVGLPIALPTHIGCGLANGNWVEIKPLIEEVFEGCSVDVTFYHYEK